MSFDPERPYNDLPLLPPPGELETKSVLKLCIEARAALADLDRISRQIPNQDVLVETIPLLEAQASSEVENVVTTSDRLFQFAQTTDDKADAATREALRYREALRLGFELLHERPLSTAIAIEVCRVIRNVDVEIRRVPGTQIINPRTRQVVYTPPVGETLLRDLLSDWERFLHNADSIDPLIRMAVGHYQFEAIHPFTDGNGRTGRILNVLFICEQQLLRQPILHLSRHINLTRSDYYDGLTSVTNQSRWQDWLIYLINGVRETAEWTVKKAEALIQLQEDTAEFVRRRGGKIYSHELVEVILRQPYTRITDVVEAGLAKRETASIYLKRLRDIGVLDEVVIGREKLFLNRKMRDLVVSDEHTFQPY